ncbi:homoprotocatechuate degradation operon regulator HpaR [Profundibacter sp.]|uniref:homoprotocatechuate degradation operon regulator HpaR n=1 Tax=Profundibacter sp. TaxID=3101071 RepID=UPI003D0B470D
MKDYDRALPIALLRAREATLRPFRKELEKIGLTVQQWRVIRALAEGEALSASALSEMCVLMPPSLSRIMKNLTERGLIERVEDNDARRRMVRITAKGQAKYDAMSGQAAEVYARIEQAFGAAKMEQLLDLLVELREAVERDVV